MDLSAFTLAELKTLFADLPKAIAIREKQERNETLKALEALAAERGFSLGELMGDKQDAEPKTRTPVAAKYRDPVSGATWSGRGRRPTAFVGKNLDDCRI